MTSMHTHYQAYAAATQTVAKTRQVVILYEGAIRFIQQAKEAIHERRIEDRYHLLIRASSIINGLQSCLDFEKGGEVARILYQFYSSVDSRLFAIHHTGSAEACDEIIADLKQMRDVWHEIDQGTAGDDEQEEGGGRGSGKSPASSPESSPSSVTFSA